MLPAAGHVAAAVATPARRTRARRRAQRFLRKPQTPLVRLETLRSAEPAIPIAPATAMVAVAIVSGHPAASRMIPWMRARMGIPLVPPARRADPCSAVPSNYGNPPPWGWVAGVQLRWLVTWHRH